MLLDRSLEYVLRAQTAHSLVPDQDRRWQVSCVWAQGNKKCPGMQMIWTIADQGQETLLRTEMGRGSLERVVRRTSEHKSILNCGKP